MGGCSHKAWARGFDVQVRWQGSRPELFEGGVALEGLGERHAALGAELIGVEPAHTAKEEGEKERVQRAVGAPLARQAHPSALGSRAGLAARTPAR